MPALMRWALVALVAYMGATVVVPLPAVIADGTRFGAVWAGQWTLPLQVAVVVLSLLAGLRAHRPPNDQ